MNNNNNNNNFYYSTSFQYLTNCILNITDDCNLRCKYCFVKQSPNYMSLDTAIAAVNWLYNNLLKKEKLGILKNDDNHYINITFFGGEPMLCYDSLIVPLVEYCNNTFPNIFLFNITTNGTLLTQENILFFKKYNFNILLSIDGNKITQNYNRPLKASNTKITSFDLISNNIPLLLENFPNLECRATIYADSVQNLFQDYLYIESLGVKNWDMVIDSRHLWDQEKINILKEQMSQIYQYRLNQIINKEPIMNDSLINKWFNYTLLSFNNNEIQNSNIFTINRCGLGTSSGAIGWDGSIYGCQEKVTNQKDSIFLIGNIFKDGIDIQKHYQLLFNYYNSMINIYNNKILKCQNCNLQSVCSKNIIQCPSLNYELFNQMDITSDIECQMRKIYYYNSLLTLKIIFNLSDDNILKYFNLIINNIN